MSVVTDIKSIYECSTDLAYEIYYAMDIDFSEVSQAEYEDEIERAYRVVSHKVNL